MDKYPPQIRDMISFLDKTEKVNKEIGKLGYSEFQFNGGIIKLVHLPKYGQYTFLVFVSSTKEGIEELKYHSGTYMNEILSLTDQILKKS